MWQRMACSAHFNPFNSLQTWLLEKIQKPRKKQKEKSSSKATGKRRCKVEAKGKESGKDLA